MEISLTFDGGKLWHDGQPVGCHVYAMCENQAVKLHPFGALGDIPSCQRCADRTDSLGQTQES